MGAKVVKSDKTIQNDSSVNGDEKKNYKNEISFQSLSEYNRKIKILLLGKK